MDMCCVFSMFGSLGDWTASGMGSKHIRSSHLAKARACGLHRSPVAAGSVEEGPVVVNAGLQGVVRSWLWVLGAE